MRALPSVGCSKPAIILMVVVLPAPFGPRNPNTSPWETFEVNAVYRDKIAVFFCEIDEFDHRMFIHH